jgi:polysaccharide deacetylase 2 family uncharacterized protein YibQ
VFPGNRAPQSHLDPHRSNTISFAVLFLIVLAISISGCRKGEKPPAIVPAQVHAITREMLRASAFIVHTPGAVESHLQFDGVHPSRPDRLLITLAADIPEKSRQESLNKLIQSLDRIATANNLTRDTRTPSGALARLDYRRAGLLTHSIDILERNISSSASRDFPQHDHPPRLAIILDDLGNDRAAANAIFALHYPLTISVLPNQSHSADIAGEAHRLGYQVMLHLPMQAVASQKSESMELRPGMSSSDVNTMLAHFIQAVPGVVGVNNHQGSQSTADPALMSELMPALVDRNLFYVDSRTTAATVAYETARRFGVRSAFRNVPFLDDVAEVGAVRKQLQLALRGAREKGEAIAIGHPHPATLQALREVLPRAQSEGIRLVFASDLAR